MRKRNTVKISFFAFQDIITSTTGILILITLILTFFLNAESIIGESDDLSELENKLANIEKTIDGNRKEIEQLDDVLNNWAHYDPQNLAKEIKDLQGKKDAIGNRVAQLRIDQADAIALATALTTARANGQAIQYLINDVTDRINALDGEAKRMKNANILFPNLSSSLTNKRLLLIVLTAGKLDLIEFSGGRKLKKSFPSRASLKTYLETKTPAAVHHLVFFVKPSGIDSFNRLHGNKLKGGSSVVARMGFKYIGWDVLEEDVELAIP